MLGHILNTLFQFCSFKDRVSKNFYILRYQVLEFSIRTSERYILDYNRCNIIKGLSTKLMGKFITLCLKVDF